MIDDDPLALKLVKSALSSSGYEVRLAGNGKEGLAAATKEKPDLILLDYVMPEMDGLDFICILKGAENTKNIPVVMITSNFDEKLRQDGLAAGVVDFLYKPFTPEDLKEFIDSLFERGQLEEADKSKILVIEDSKILCKIYEQILSKTGHEFMIVDESIKALDRVREFGPDLILMDGNMPDIDGFELTKRIKADKDLENIRIIMVTSDTKKKSTLKALEYGVVDFLTKPFDEEVLLARMRVHLNNKKLYDDLSKAYEEMKILKDKLERLSITDGLTGLYNHRHFHEVLKDEISRGGRYGTTLSLLLFDIDHFKKFNDTYGHKSGDRVLKTIASVIEKSKRDSDIAARYGGEEFAVILPQTGIAGAEKIAERIRKNIEINKVDLTGDVVSVTVSIGVAEWAGEDNEDKLVVRADEALYRSKENGRNRVTVAA